MCKGKKYYCVLLTSSQRLVELLAGDCLSLNELFK